MSHFRLVMAVFAPALAWAVFHITAWALTPAVCETGLEMFIVAVAVITGLVSILGGILAWRAGPGWINFRGNQDSATEGNPHEWLAILGVFFSVIFTVSILASLGGVYALDACTL